MKRGHTDRSHNLVDYGNYRTLGSFDVIFCRNVLIYFDDAVKAKVIKGFHEALPQVVSACGPLGIHPRFQRRIRPHALQQGHGLSQA